MSPETFYNCKYNDKTDLFSLGLVYYEMIIGTLPFNAVNKQELDKMYQKYRKDQNIYIFQNIQVMNQKISLEICWQQSLHRDILQNKLLITNQYNNYKVEVEIYFFIKLLLIMNQKYTFSYVLLLCMISLQIQHHSFSQFNSLMELIFNKNTITSKGSSYSNYIYTFTLPQSNDQSDPICLLPYQIETNQAFQEYLDGSENILERFKNALTLEENYITIMNMCVISLNQRKFNDIEIRIKQKYIQKETFLFVFLESQENFILYQQRLYLRHLNTYCKYINIFYQQQQTHIITQFLLLFLHFSIIHKLFLPFHLQNFLISSRLGY